MMKVDRHVFRGWDAVGSKGWVYGDLVHNQKVTVDGLEPRVMVGGYEVSPESVGQCTGFRDIDGRLIYEDDLVQYVNTGDVRVVVYDRYGFCAKLTKNSIVMPSNLDNCRVIGTYYESVICL
jgi:hypothetical protein